MAAALSLAMPKEAFDQFLADTYGIDGLNKLEASPTACDGCTPREKAFPQGRRRNFFFVDYLPTLALRAASGRA